MQISIKRPDKPAAFSGFAGKLGIGGMLAFMLAAPSVVHAATCDALQATSTPQMKIMLSETVAAGAFSPEAAGESAPEAQKAKAEAFYKQLPSFCRVAAILMPTKDSKINIEVWMPSEKWNGKYLGVGNGGWGGTINYNALAQGLKQGFAVASTDDGTSGIVATNPATWSVLSNTERLKDFGFRATHLMTLEAKKLIEAFYASKPRYSYWNACSTGGKQGLTEAQRYPADYDGIIEGDPANYFTHLMFGLQWNAAAARKDPSGLIPPAKFSLLHQAVLQTCETKDSLSDGVVNDPAKCHFDTHVLACKDGDKADCLTAAQVETVQAIYDGAKNPHTGEQIFPGEAPGSELGWAGMLHIPGPTVTSNSFFVGALFKNPDWKPESINFDADVKLADEQDAVVLNAMDPDLKAFKARGGKLIMYHGWSDPIIVPMVSVNYYDSVVKAMGGTAKTDDFVRLFMVPGMGHCGGGSGADSFDKMAPIENWIEKGIAPDAIIASHMEDGKATMTRPLCPYPKIAQWNGKGNRSEASNFACVNR